MYKTVEKSSSVNQNSLNYYVVRWCQIIHKIYINDTVSVQEKQSDFE